MVYDDIILPVTDMEVRALRFIADNKMYRFDKANYRLVVAGLIPDDKVTCENVDAHPLSLVTHYKLSSVKACIDVNTDVFARNIFIGSEEDSDTIVSMLRHPSLSDEVKVEILEKMQFTVPDLHLFKEEVDVGVECLSWHDLFYRYDHVEPEWTPLLDYIYEECNLPVLTGYINKHAVTLSNQHVDLVDGDKYDLLYMKVICNDDISDSAYTAVLKSLLINFKWWDERLSFNNFQRIIKNNKVSLSTESFEKTMELFGSITDDTECETFLYWFTRYKNEFLSNTDFYLRAGADDAFLEEMLTGICRSADFSVKEKAELLLEYNDRYSEPFLQHLRLSSDVITALIKLSGDDGLKISLIIRMLNDDNLRSTDVANLVAELDEKEYTKLFTQKTATLMFSNNKEAGSLMSALQQNALIIKWTVRDDGKYSVTCRKESSQEEGES